MSPTTPRLLKILTFLSAFMFLMALSLVFFYAPLEASMGEAQRIFYFHVAAAWVGFFAFFVTLVVGIIYLRTGNPKWDRLAVSSVEIGIVFSTMTLMSGVIWQRPIWNTWWTWDPRVTTFTILLLIYFAYLMLRQGIEDPDRRGRFAAVYGIVAFVSVPITYFSARLLRTIHPIVIGTGDPLAEGTFNMVAPMAHTMFFCLAFFTVFYFTLLWHRQRLADDAERVEYLKAKLTSA